MFNQLKENDHLLCDDVKKVLAKIWEKKDMNEMQVQLQEVNRRHAQSQVQLETATTKDAALWTTEKSYFSKGQDMRKTNPEYVKSIAYINNGGGKAMLKQQQANKQKQFKMSKRKTTQPE